VQSVPCGEQCLRVRISLAPNGARPMLR